MTETDVFTRLAEKVNFPKSRYIRQVFQKLATPMEGEMLMALPASPAELASEFQLTIEEVNGKLDEFVRKGLVIPFERGGSVKHSCVSHIIQFHDASIHATINHKYEPVQEEIVLLWQHFRETEWFEVLREMEESKKGRMRVIPSSGSLKDSSSLLPCENLRTILKEAPTIGLVDCPCRWLRVKEGACDKPTFVCFSLTPGSVKYIVDRGIGKKIELEEAYETLDLCEKAGLIPTTGGGQQVRNLCFCCSDCCILLRAQLNYGYDLTDKSRYQASINRDLCNGCQNCVERCHFNAIDMKKDGKTKKYKAFIKTESCFGCGLCVTQCPTQALDLELVRPAEYLLKTTN